MYLIRGPTHIAQTDAWVSRGDTLSLFKRRGGLIGNCCCAGASKIVCRLTAIWYIADWVMSFWPVARRQSPRPVPSRAPRASGSARAAGAWPSTMLLIFLRRGPAHELVIAISEWLCVSLYGVLLNIPRRRETSAIQCSHLCPS